MRERMSSDFEQPVRFFGRYTWKDLIRLGAPLAYVFITTDLSESIVEVLPLAVLGGFVGFLWYRWRPYGEPFDVHLYHLARWILVGVFR